MEGKVGESSGGSRYNYKLEPTKISNEDILFCIDIGPESLVEMKTSGSKGRPFTRLDAIKQSITIFINAKSTINPDHRFAFCTLANSVSWLRKDFTSDVQSACAALRGLSATTISSRADLTSLFQLAAHEAINSNAQNRILRVILIYCRSSTPPQHQWSVNRKLFTLDAIYLHDKPGPGNCPQEVYDKLVDALEHVTEYEGYILESGQSLARALFRYMCILVSHPQQRIMQEYVDLPKPLTKKVPPAESAPGEESAVPISNQ